MQLTLVETAQMYLHVKLLGKAVRFIQKKDVKDNA